MDGIKERPNETWQDCEKKLQSVKKYLRLTLVSMWNGVLQ